MAHPSTDTFTSIYKSGELNTIKKGYWSHPSIGYLHTKVKNNYKYHLVICYTWILPMLRHIPIQRYVPNNNKRLLITWMARGWTGSLNVMEGWKASWNWMSLRGFEHDIDWRLYLYISMKSGQDILSPQKSPRHFVAPKSPQIWEELSLSLTYICTYGNVSIKPL